MKKKLNLANKITISRIFIIIIIIALFIFRDIFQEQLRQYTVLTNTYNALDFVIFILFVIGTITDFLDGYVARKYNQITTFGKFLDPIADKLLINTIFIMLAVHGRIYWIVTLIMISRDMIVDMIRLIMVERNKVVAASFWGKFKTVTQIAALIIILILTNPNYYIAVNIIAAIPALFSVLSGIDYFIKAKKEILVQE